MPYTLDELKAHCAIIDHVLNGRHTPEQGENLLGELKAEMRSKRAQEKVLIGSFKGMPVYANQSFAVTAGTGRR